MKGVVAPPEFCKPHHIEWWVAHHGHTDVDKLVLVCEACHTGIHNGTFEVVRRGDGSFVVATPDRAAKIRTEEANPAHAACHDRPVHSNDAARRHKPAQPGRAAQPDGPFQPNKPPHPHESIDSDAHDAFDESASPDQLFDDGSVTDSDLTSSAEAERASSTSARSREWSA